ncbi:MAG TPA: hypothetical protein DDY71_05235 [Spirochaetia bacterium]|nr:hypothetical protein [Spirochaetia bacterium]
MNKDLLNITIDSIRANAVSLLAQLNEYDFLKVTKEQARQLEQIERDFHRLVAEITESHK